MRNLISNLNVLAAVAVACFVVLSLLSSINVQVVVLAIGSIAWVVCAFALLRSRRTWAWVGSLLGVAGLIFYFGAETLRLLGLSWQAGYGDRSVKVDPSTIGIPLFFSGLITVSAVLGLAALLTLPAWSPKKGANA